MMARSMGVELWEVYTMTLGSTQSFDRKYIGSTFRSARNIMKSSRGKYKSMRARSTCIHNGKYRCSLAKVQSLPEFARQIMASSVKMKGSTTIANKKCKVSIKEVHILIFEGYNNPMIFIFFIRYALPLFLEHNKNHTIQKSNGSSNDCLNMHKMG
jgi:hypothetical protein